MHCVIKSLFVQTTVRKQLNQGSNRFMIQSLSTLSVLNDSYQNDLYQNVVPIKPCFDSELAKNILYNKKTIEEQVVYNTLANAGIMIGVIMLFENYSFGFICMLSGINMSLDSMNQINKSKTTLNDIKKSCEFTSPYKCTCIVNY